MLNRVLVHLRRETPETLIAIDIIERWQRGEIDDPEHEDQQGDPLDMTLASLGVNVRILNSLESIGVFTVRDLLNKRREQLAALPNFGNTSMRQLLDKVRTLGIELPDIEFGGPEHSKCIADFVKLMLEHGPLTHAEIAARGGWSVQGVRAAMTRKRELFRRLPDGRMANKE